MVWFAKFIERKVIQIRISPRKPLRRVVSKSILYKVDIIQLRDRLSDKLDIVTQNTLLKQTAPWRQESFEICWYDILFKQSKSGK